MLTCEWLRTLRIISYVPPHLGNIKSPVMMLSNIEVNNVTKPRRTHIMGFFFFSLAEAKSLSMWERSNEFNKKTRPLHL